MADTKRLVFCFDGTWNRLDAKTPTNVVLTAESIVPTGKSGTAQSIWYDQGVGTSQRERWTGGLLGFGVDKILADAYRFLIFNYMPGDDIYVFGFSRGAYTARSFVGLLRNCGIVSRRDADRVSEAVALYRSRGHDASPDALRMNEFRASASPDICVSPDEKIWRTDNIDGFDPALTPMLEIRYLGIWDTVGALGVPASLGFVSRWFNRRYQFHDTVLTPRVRFARHAVAIDERRASFAPSLWDNLSTMNELRGKTSADPDAPYLQKWFPGVHGSVGGGGDRRGLSDQALDWVWDGARNAGLELDCSRTSRVYGLAPSYREWLDNSTPPAKPGIMERLMHLLPRADRLPGPQTLHEVSVSARQRWLDEPDNLPEKTRYRPPTLRDVDHALGRLVATTYGLDQPQSDGFTLHEVAVGETLGDIALRVYGNKALYTLIFEANRNKLSDPNRIYVGMMLRIPPLPASSVAPAIAP